MNNVEEDDNGEDISDTSDTSGTVSLSSVEEETHKYMNTESDYPKKYQKSKKVSNIENSLLLIIETSCVPFYHLQGCHRFERYHILYIYQFRVKCFYFECMLNIFCYFGMNWVLNVENIYFEPIFAVILFFAIYK